ncbi:hypothetical protein SDC9_167082 [bioreactor metagenome]|uniref:Uncharacterized protein n=1 Tax=bioreactor metagenome TaxID=1076179 RepID=A0A645G1E8_9ZZZZ
MVTILPGVFPIIFLASSPTATTLLLLLSIATIDGSLRIMPLSLMYTKLVAVPMSIAISLSILKKLINFPLLTITCILKLVLEN